ncbi:hypothetical protein PG994_004051 [Apiospora phragmitis]|uniref:Uncharacterized protein n=1 Tax=Apiospora phragmitis TaxID=2905665 RepID=A0ABR1VZV3_9PEZI
MLQQSRLELTARHRYDMIGQVSSTVDIVTISPDEASSQSHIQMTFVDHVLEDFIGGAYVCALHQPVSNTLRSLASGAGEEVTEDSGVGLIMLGPLL